MGDQDDVERVIEYPALYANGVVIGRDASIVRIAFEERATVRVSQRGGVVMTVEAAKEMHRVLTAVLFPDKEVKT